MVTGRFTKAERVIWAGVFGCDFHYTRDAGHAADLATAAVLKLRQMAMESAADDGRVLWIREALNQ